MDIVLLDQKAIRIKGKNSAIVIDPNTSTQKVEVSAIIMLEDSADFSDKKIEGSRITVKGPGEYEIGGAKISGIKVGEKLVVRIDIDGVKVLVGSGASIEKISDKIDASDVVVINSDSEFNNSFIMSLEPKVVLLYGQRKEETAKTLGSETAEKVSKFSTTLEKLPSELQILILE